MLWIQASKGVHRAYLKTLPGILLAYKLATEFSEAIYSQILTHFANAMLQMQLPPLQVLPFIRG